MPTSTVSASAHCVLCQSQREPHTDRTPTCTVCVRYNALTTRSRRRDPTAHVLTLAEFTSWFHEQERVCRFCNIAEASLAAVGQRSQTGLPVARLGVDRLENAYGYQAPNMALCCFVCNRTKSDAYTTSEMAILGRGIADVWSIRLTGGLRQTGLRVPDPQNLSWPPATPTTPGRDGEQCRRCGAVREAHTARVPTCTVCFRFDRMRTNAARVRRDGSTPTLEFTRETFATWFAQQQRCCAYCQVPEHVIPRLNIRTQVHNVLARLGIDRLDNAAGYRDGNVSLACLACNQLRSNTFTVAETHMLGTAVRAVWWTRLRNGDEGEASRG